MEKFSGYWITIHVFVKYTNAKVLTVVRRNKTGI